MSTKLQFVVAICCLLLLVTATGCKKGIERAMVSGTATWDGKPIPYGEIRFVPIGETKGPSWTAWIIDGKYTTVGSKGTPVGELKVEITAYRPIGGVKQFTGPDDNAGGGAPQEQYIPAKYNRLTELKMTIEPGAGKVEKDFVLESK